jgi:putative FmdB family regulatory protein
MPIYAYICDACGHEQDSLQKLSDPILRVCPVCNAEKYRRKLTAAGFQLKGTGWYVTDFRDSGSKAPAKPSTEVKSAGDEKPTAQGAQPAPGAADQPGASRSAEPAPGGSATSSSSAKTSDAATPTPSARSGGGAPNPS